MSKSGDFFYWWCISSTTIETLLSEGTIVICDRYAFSGISFSASKGLPLEWCRSPDISLPSPDLTLFLDISPEKAKERGGYGEERYEKEQMQRRVAEIFDTLAQEIKGNNSQWAVIDAGQEKDVVAEEIWGHVVPLMDGVSWPLDHLWVEKLRN